MEASLHATVIVRSAMVQGVLYLRVVMVAQQVLAVRVAAVAFVPRTRANSAVSIVMTYGLWMIAWDCVVAMPHRLLLVSAFPRHRIGTGVCVETLLREGRTIAFGAKMLTDVFRLQSAFQLDMIHHVAYRLKKVSFTLKLLSPLAQFRTWRLWACCQKIYVPSRVMMAHPCSNAWMPFALTLLAGAPGLILTFWLQMAVITQGFTCTTQAEQRLQIGCLVTTQ